MEYPSGECKCCDKLADENVALKEQVAQWETEYNGCSAMLDNAERIIEILEETIGQQAAVIEQMQEVMNCLGDHSTAHLAVHPNANIGSVVH